MGLQVARLQEQLQKERDLRVALDAGLKMSPGKLPNLTAVDEKVSFPLFDQYYIKIFGHVINV